MVAAMTSAARLSVSSPSSAIEAASAFPAAGLPRSSVRSRFPSTSFVGLSSRAALSSGGKYSSAMHRGRAEFAGVSVNAAIVSSTVDLDARRPEVETAIDEAMENCITETHLNDSIPSLGPKTRGKVRDIYEAGDYMVLVTTDRQSAFDRILASVPFKSQVLNQTSVWWFDSTKHITDSAIVSAPNPNVTIAKKCTVFPLELVARVFRSGQFITRVYAIIVARISLKITLVIKSLCSYL